MFLHVIFSSVYIFLLLWIIHVYPDLFIFKKKKIKNRLSFQPNICSNVNFKTFCDFDFNYHLDMDNNGELPYLLMYFLVVDIVAFKVLFLWSCCNSCYCYSLYNPYNTYFGDSEG